MRNRPGRTATRRTTQATEVTTSRPHLVHALYFSAARAFHVRDGHSLSLSRLFFGAATPALHALTASSRYSSQTKDARRETKGKKREESHEALKGTRQCRWWTETPPQPAGRAPRRKRGTGRADAVEQPHRQTDTRSGAGEKWAERAPQEAPPDAWDAVIIAALLPPQRVQDAPAPWSSSAGERLAPPFPSEAKHSGRLEKEIRALAGLRERKAGKCAIHFAA